MVSDFTKFKERLEADASLKIDDGTRQIILSLLSDFVFLEEQINKLREYPRYIINPANHEQQKKLPVHEMLKDYQAQKNDIATKILRTLNGESSSDSELLKALEKFNKND